MKRSGHKWFSIGKHEFRFEWHFGLSLHWRLERDEGLKVAVSLLFVRLFFGVEGPLFPPRKYGHGRELSLSMHGGAAYWNIWTDNMGWSSKTPRWRNGSFDPRDFLLGRRKYSEDLIEEREVLVPLPERSYRGKAELVVAKWKRSRWPFAARMRRIHIKMAEGEQIPEPGKGENSWDCGEDATFGLTCPADSIEDGIGRLVASVLETRRNRGGREWVPESVRRAVP